MFKKIINWFRVVSIKKAMKKAEKIRNNAQKIRNNTQKIVKKAQSKYTGNLQLQLDTVNINKAVKSNKATAKALNKLDKNDKFERAVKRKYQVKGKGLDLIVEEVDNKLSTKSQNQTREEWYEENKKVLRFASALKKRIKATGKFYNSQGGISKDKAIEKLSNISNTPRWIKQLQEDIIKGSTNGKFTNVKLEEEAAKELIKEMSKKK